MKPIGFLGVIYFLLFSLSFIYTEDPLQLPTAKVVPASSAFAKDGAIDLTVVGGYEPFRFEWSTGEKTEDISNLAPGIYTVHIYDRYCGVVFADIKIAGCSPIIIQGETRNVCDLNSGEIILNVTGGSDQNYSFLWSNNQREQNLFDLQEGNYSVTVTDGGGCFATMEFSILTYNMNQALPCYENEQAEVEEDKPAKAKIYPNPFINELYVEVSSRANDVIKIQLFDILGRQILSEDHEVVKGKNSIKINNLHHLKKGIYQIIVIDANKNRSITNVIHE